MASYVSFAQFYDGLMEDANYSERCDYILEIAKRHNHKMGITLDLACGTGSLTRLLKKKGVDVYGADASAEMLSEAMQRSFEDELDILFLRQRMRSLDLYASTSALKCKSERI